MKKTHGHPNEHAKHTDEFDNVEEEIHGFINAEYRPVDSLKVISTSSPIP